MAGTSPANDGKATAHFIIRPPETAQQIGPQPLQQAVEDQSQQRIVISGTNMSTA